MKKKGRKIQFKRERNAPTTSDSSDTSMVRTKLSYKQLNNDFGGQYYMSQPYYPYFHQYFLRNQFPYGFKWRRLVGDGGAVGRHMPFGSRYVTMGSYYKLHDTPNRSITFSKQF